MPLTPAQVRGLHLALGGPAYSRLVLCPPAIGLWTPRWAAVVGHSPGGFLLAVPTDERLTEVWSANVDVLDEMGRTPHPCGASINITVAAQRRGGTVRADELLMSATLVDVSTGAYQLLRLAAPRASPAAR